MVVIGDAEEVEMRRVPRVVVGHRGVEVARGVYARCGTCTVVWMATIRVAGLVVERTVVEVVRDAGIVRSLRLRSDAPVWRRRIENHSLVETLVDDFGALTGGGARVGILVTHFTASLASSAGGAHLDVDDGMIDAILKVSARVVAAVPGHGELHRLAGGEGLLGVEMSDFVSVRVRNSKSPRNSCGAVDGVGDAAHEIRCFPRRTEPPRVCRQRYGAVISPWRKIGSGKCRGGNQCHQNECRDPNEASHLRSP